MMTPAQLRAARGLLDWTRNECAKAVGVSPETIKNFEQGKHTPSLATQQKIADAFSAHGVVFFTHIGVALQDTNVLSKGKAP